MKFVIRNFEIDIKAKNLGLGEDRNNKDAVMTFLNEVCIWMHESADYTAFQSRNDDGYYGDKPDAVELGKKAGALQRKDANELYKQLRAMGCYNR